MKLLFPLPVTPTTPITICSGRFDASVLCRSGSTSCQAVVSFTPAVYQLVADREVDAQMDILSVRFDTILPLTPKTAVMRRWKRE